MAQMKIDTGPVSATDTVDGLDPLPSEKWNDLLRARRIYLHINLPHDCRCLLDWVVEAQKFRMWEKTGYKSLEDLIQHGLELDPLQVEWALVGLKQLKPDWAIPFDEAVKTGKLLSKHGGDRKSDAAKNQGVDNTLIERGTSRKAYIKARLERDGKTELLGRVNAGALSAHAAATEAGWRKRMIQHEPTVEGFTRAITRHLSESEREELKGRI